MERPCEADSIGTVTRKFVNAIDPNFRERVERRVQVTLDIAYLPGNLGG